MTTYGSSPWVDRFPKSRLPSFPRYRGTSTVDVVIVGGGLTGCASAYAFAAAGVKVMLLEAIASVAERPQARAALFVTTLAWTRSSWKRRSAPARHVVPASRGAVPLWTSRRFSGGWP